MSTADIRRVATVGAGSIGVAFAVVFARAGWPVRLFDPDASRRDAAPGEIKQRLDELAGFGFEYAWRHQFARAEDGACIRTDGRRTRPARSVDTRAG
ncbi:3-hydroxyacyl-CoA dehydrogenase NAD-binding domain-containing protein [Caballeronia sordidicola]|uniref:3-hydroxyacyl-CoA dehydrogenase NAD-binding domain-containing protein n=1 Tax=Caballeronia sordidicola TaxID=196367 RepID=UPI000B791D6A